MYSNIFQLLALVALMYCQFIFTIGEHVSFIDMQADGQQNISSIRVQAESNSENKTMTADLLWCLIECSLDDYCPGIRIEKGLCISGPDLNRTTLNFTRLDSFILRTGPPLINAGDGDGSNQLMVNLVPFDKHSDIFQLDFFAGSANPFNVHIFKRPDPSGYRFQVLSTIKIIAVQLGFNQKVVAPPVEVQPGDYYGIWWNNWVIKKTTFYYNGTRINTGTVLTGELDDGDFITMSSVSFREYRLQISARTRPIWKAGDNALSLPFENGRLHGHMKHNL